MSDSIKHAAEAILAGQLVIFPTETVYGIGANAFDPLAVSKIFAAKNRPTFNPLIVHIADKSQLDEVVSEIPPLAQKLMDAFWPGPLTVVLPKRSKIPDIVTARLPTVAVRLPNHPVALELLRTAQVPIAAPSANFFGRLSPTKIENVNIDLIQKADVLLSGGSCNVGVESTIISFNKDVPQILRLGGISLEEIQEVIGPVQTFSSGDILAPGMLKNHYSPKTPLHFLELGTRFPQGKRLGLLAYQENKTSFPFTEIRVLSKNGSLPDAAQHLYASIQELDNCDLDAIIAYPFPDEGLGRVVNDRLRRASV